MNIIVEAIRKWIIGLRINSKSLGGHSGHITLEKDSNASTGLLGPSVAILVGHSRSGDKGASSWDSTESEWSYNNDIAKRTKRILKDYPIKVSVFNKYPGDTYSEAIRKLAQDLNTLSFDLVIELHFNSFANNNANGYENLYWHSSKKALKAASLIQQSFKDLFPEQHKDRKVKPILYLNQRGALILKTTKAPTVICEPFFGSNKSEWKFFKSPKGRNTLAKAYAKAITTFLGLLEPVGCVSR